MVTEILFLLVLVMINAFFAASEIALISLNDNRIKVMAEDGNKKAMQLVKLLGEPSRFLATIQVGITLAGFLASAFAAQSFADPIVVALQNMNLPVSDGVLRAVTLVVITLILSYFTLVFGELVPKRIAMKKSDKIAFFSVGILTFLSIVTAPLVKLLTISTNFFLRLAGIDPNSLEDDVTEEEIRMMVDIGEERGAINAREKTMINNIFEFNNTTVSDIMTHRIDMFSVSVDIDLEELISAVKDEHYTRIPVYEETVDNIIGILHLKDLIFLINEESTDDFKIRDKIRKPYFVPEGKKIDELFVTLQKSKTHIAVVIDEYGGTAGIVTMEDLIEEIVGNIFDEFDEEEIEFRKIDENTYEVSGMISLDDLIELIDVDLPIDDYETFSGFLIGLIGNIPSKGDVMEIEYQNLRIKILDVSDKRIEKTVVYLSDKNME
ncbi:hemolysin family protein [Acetobacterium bakii]|uniref:Hemolysin-related protein containing CBS domains n=1 Tax=Acetobacterium bakii TaxID=52689 RepID=A0A0L6TWB5_9FIRM|nr:hemolysin family protein [Acetobacterium bakii]KNZ40342.1 hemolysin-related protein containing CBS domains [Acetobacterium bakii]